MAAGQWYYCLTHHTVEPYEGCRQDTRLGPYETPEAAADALKLVAARNVVWENDPRYREPDDDEVVLDEDDGWGSFGR